MNDSLETKILNALQAKMAEIAKPKRGKPSDLKELVGADLNELVKLVAGDIVVGIRRQKKLVALAMGVGTIVRRQLGFEFDSLKNLKVGCFLVEAFVEAGLVDMKLAKVSRKDKNQSYIVTARDEDALSELWGLVPESSSTLPQAEAYADWHAGVHENGMPMIKHAPLAVLREVHPSQQVATMTALNKMQSTPWMINEDVFAVFNRASNNIRNAMTEVDGKQVSCFSYVFESNSRSKKSKRLEVLSLKQIVKKLREAGVSEFHHQYNCDFRGRIYPTTAFLHEQGSDNAKGLLLLAEGEKLGNDGLGWLCVHATNSWGEDKLPIDDRAQFALDHQDEWIGYAEAPFVNRGWMTAEKPWAFLACCFELKKISEFEGDVADYVCHLPVFIDGSNNGVQWLAALSKDETIAPHVNLVPQELPGDIYAFIAEKVWEGLDAKADQKLVGEMEAYVALLIEYGKQLETLSGDEWVAVREELVKIREAMGKEKVRELGLVFWQQVADKKIRRKTCKRPVMTLGYGGTKIGFGDQVRDDTADLDERFKFMDYSWGALMGGLIYDQCVESLPGAAAMLELFRKVCARFTATDRKFRWTVPVTNFPVVQQYKTAREARARVTLCGEEISLTYQVVEDKKINSRKQRTSSSPNVIHSFDAAHLQLVVANTEFATPTVHDSFGCLPGRMGEYFRTVRELFAEFVEIDPLAELLEQTDSEDLMPERGSLDLWDVTRSDYAFA